jgi:hypothetical protein
LIARAANQLANAATSIVGLGAETGPRSDTAICGQAFIGAPARGIADNVSRQSSTPSSRLISPLMPTSGTSKAGLLIIWA